MNTGMLRGTRTNETSIEELRRRYQSYTHWGDESPIEPVVKGDQHIFAGLDSTAIFVIQPDAITLDVYFHKPWQHVTRTIAQLR